MSLTVPVGEQGPVVACITPWGQGAISVVRLSGMEIRVIVEAVCGCLPAPQSVRQVKLRDQHGFFDEGLLLWMPAPRSYTGEDVAEISCHGNPLLVERLLQALIAQGARMARPGEFTRRAFLNGKMDLCRAEAVLQTLNATSNAGLALAQAGREGAISQQATALRAELADIAAEFEAILDYPGEDLIFSTDAQLIARLKVAQQAAQTLADSFQAGHRAIEGATVVLLGPVNAGKSSLFNALLGRSRALVSAQPGTTRDIVESSLQLSRVRVQLHDTAGLRETQDAIEAEGVEMARNLAVQADLRLIVFPLHQPLDPEVQALLALEGPCLRVGTHWDQQAELPDLGFSYLPVSSKSAAGLDALKQALEEALVGEEPGTTRLILGSARQRDLFAAVAEASAAAAVALQRAGPAAAAEFLYEALEALDTLTGQDTRESVLDRLFQRFCVGK